MNTISSTAEIGMGSPTLEIAEGVRINKAAWTDQSAALLTPDAVSLIAEIHRAIEPERQRLLAARAVRSSLWDTGELPTYVPLAQRPWTTPDWQVAPIPKDLRRRRVEITGPIGDRKMVINMLSRNADGYRADAAMLDFEDSQKPSWRNVVQGIENLVGAARGDLEFHQEASATKKAKTYTLDPKDRPLIMVRVRGLHLGESNFLVDDQPVSAGLFDFTLSAFHSAQILLNAGQTPKYYIPKCEHFLEARWWNRLFELVQEGLKIPLSTFKATLLMETLPAAFQMEEILYEFRNHAAGLNVGRWDKIFSDIKVLKEHPDRILADRSTISLNRPWMDAYARQLIEICHRHGAWAMGGMAAFTPGRTAERRLEQTEKVLTDKRHEYAMGHDGCWVSHPYFVGPALSAFPRDHQLDRLPDPAENPSILPVACEPRTLAGVRTNVRVGIAYMQGWNADIGCVAWDDLMEDLATLEISRAQTFQWLRHEITLEEGMKVTRDLLHQVFIEELALIEDELRESKASEELIQSFRDAAFDAETIFRENNLRPFLSNLSDPADLDLKTRRARLRQNP